MTKIYFYIYKYSISATISPISPYQAVQAIYSDKPISDDKEVKSVLRDMFKDKRSMKELEYKVEKFMKEKLFAQLGTFCLIINVDIDGLVGDFQ